MSLFDTIKYPISDIPTVEELEAIPPNIWWKYVKSKENADRYSKPKDLPALEEYANIVWMVINKKDKKLKETVRRLRKAIAEYDHNESL